MLPLLFQNIHPGFFSKGHGKPWKPLVGIFCNLPESKQERIKYQTSSISTTYSCIVHVDYESLS